MARTFGCPRPATYWGRAVAALPPLYYSGLERDNEGTSPPRSVIWDINTERLPQRLSHSIGCLLAHGPQLGYIKKIRQKLGQTIWEIDIVFVPKTV